MKPMKPLSSFPLLVLIGLVIGNCGGIATVASAREETSAREASSDHGFAVVELFTSEGCSSCPPADRVLNRITRQGRQANAPVYTLAFHVDYWDRLGWADPFDKAAYSRRQRTYGRHFGIRSIYTPQMIVNGREQFVGSNARKAKDLIARALRQPRKTTLNLKEKSAGPAGRRVRVTYRLGSAPAKARLNVALVERGLVTHVKRGENGGRTLHHDNVVRAFRTVAVNHGHRGRVELRVPASVDRDKASVIGYVQDGSSMRVLAAARADLMR